MIPNLLWQNEIKDTHPICIYDISFSPDGQTLLAAADNKVYVFDTKNGTLIQTLKGHKDVIITLSFSRDGKRFATGSIDKQVIIWTSKLEAILKYTHNEAIRCLQYNPTSYQILSCTNSDFGLWSPDQKNVSKVKVTSQINCCCWNDDGIVFALGFNCGVVSIRFKNGEEKIKIERKGPVWGVLFYKSTDLKTEDRLVLVDWAKTTATFDLNGNQSVQERNLNYDPLFITSFMNNEFLLIGGTNKQAILYTIDGIQLETISKKESWIWCCKPHGNRLAIGCQNGNLCLYEISLISVDCLHKELYASRHSMTNVIIQRLNTREKARIKCRDLVKKIAIYKTLLAIQLQKRIILYESNEELSYRVKEKIPLELDCSLLMLCSCNLIMCQQEQLKSFNFHGQLEREWMFKSPVLHLKTIGGKAKQESLLVALKDGQILIVFLSNIFPIELIKLNNSIKFIDMSMKRQKIAAIDEQNNCFVYDIHSKQLLYEEPNVSSIAWNSQFEDLLCLSGPGFIAIKMEDVPTQTIQFSDQKTTTEVIGYSGNKIYTINNNTIFTEEISYSKLMLHFIQQNKFNEAYQIACLNVTMEDWQLLTNSALAKSELAIGFKCICRIGDWSYQELIYSHFQLSNPFSETNKQLFLAKYYAYQGLFAESAKLFKKINQPHLALEMFTDLQMYEQAKEYQSLASNRHYLQNDPTSVKIRDNLRRPLNTTSTLDLNDLQTLSKMYIAKGDHHKAKEMIEKSDVNSIMAMVNQIDKGEIKLLNLIGETLIKNGDYVNAIQIYRKIGDFKRLALSYIQNNQWEQALKIANEMPHTKQDIYLPYAMWLAENERFAEAQLAFYESGQFEKSRQVLNRLLENSINECRFNDASYYSWLLANHYSKISTNNDQQTNGDDASLSSKSNHGHYHDQLLQTSNKLHQESEIYYAYQYIYKYIEEPFTSVYAEILFNSALFLFQFIDERLPSGVSKVYILFALAKLGKTLGHFKLVRMAYKKLKNLKLPEKLSESIQIGSIEIRTKPFVDAEELSQFCYRCSSTSSLFNSKLNQCINCNQKFIHSFYSFDILPLVEFEINENISHEEIEKILIENQQHQQENSFPLQSRRSSVTMTNNGQQSDVYTNDLMINHDGNLDQEQMINLNGGEVNDLTNLAVLNEKHLSKLNQSNVIMVKDDRSNNGHRYYLNMMPEIGIVACSNCTKFFYSDELEFQILKNGHCLFCRQ